MASPERMERLAASMERFTTLMREMDAEQAEHTRWLLAHDERLRQIQAQAQVHRTRIGEIIGEITQMQADIARLDAAS